MQNLSYIDQCQNEYQKKDLNIKLLIQPEELLNHLQRAFLKIVTNNSTIQNFLGSITSLTPLRRMQIYMTVLLSTWEVMCFKLII